MESPLVAPMSAAPGVDQAVMIGRRWRRLRKPLVAAMLRQSAATQEEVWAEVAPTAWAAAMMSAIVLPKPTRAATTADVTIDSRIGRLLWDAAHGALHNPASRRGLAV